MRAAVYHGRGDVRIQQVPDPDPPGVGEVVVAVGHVAICGTDLSEYRHGPIQIPLHQPHPISQHVGPTVIGHELAGTMAARGEGVTGLEVGDRVTSGAASRCGECRWCRHGRPNLCAHRYLYGLHAHGGAAELVRLPAAACVRVPDGCADADAALAQPLGVALHAARRSGVQPGDAVMVIGVGGVGAGVLAALGADRAAVRLAVDVNPRRLVLAAALGATHTAVAAADDPAALAGVARSLTDGGMDVVVEASGTPAGLAAAWACVRRGGRVHLIGLQPTRVPVDLAELVVGEVDVTASNGCIEEADLPDALALLAATDLGGRLRDRVIPLDALVADGLQAAAEGSVHGKVVAEVAARPPKRRGAPSPPGRLRPVD